MENTNNSDIIGRLSAFLYRRLARFITCEVRLLGSHPLAFDSKFQVNSLQDVFCHPFYWQLYGWLPKTPQLIVDLGAHCGHFSLLADTCFRIQFPDSDPEFILVEPNPKLIGTIRKNLQRSGLCRQHTIHQGLVGCMRSGTTTLWVSSKNYLSASLNAASGMRPMPANFIDLESLTKGRFVDLLKIDIEGAEFDFAGQYTQFLSRVQALMIEIHGADKEQHRLLYSRFDQAGLKLKAPPVEHGGHILAMFQRW
jgi:FkbM family methyltransferase